MTVQERTQVLNLSLRQSYQLCPSSTVRLQQRPAAHGNIPLHLAGTTAKHRKHRRKLINDQSRLSPASHTQKTHSPQSPAQVTPSSRVVGKPVPFVPPPHFLLPLLSCGLAPVGSAAGGAPGRVWHKRRGALIRGQQGREEQ